MHSSLKELVRVQLPKNGTTLIVAAGSILDFQGDAIVNAANGGCTGGFGVDEIINKAGGYKLKEARKLLNGCTTGDAKVTPSFDHTKVQHIIHAVGPVYRLKPGMDINADHTDFLKTKDPLLVSAYKASLQRAQELRVETVAFTLLSAGVFRGARPLRDILEIGLKAVGDNVYTGLREVTLVAFTDEEQRELVSLTKAIFEH